jgi:hypothetical protein
MNTLCGRQGIQNTCEEDHKQKNGNARGNSRPTTPSFPQPIPIAIAPSAGMSRSSETDMATYASTIKHFFTVSLIKYKVLDYNIEGFFNLVYRFMKCR